MNTSATPGGVRLAFGSCSKHDASGAVWAHIGARAPDAFIWLGDIVYGDTKVFGPWRIPATRETLSAYYAAQKAKPEYARFAARTRVLGVYDDHDMGMNDADKHFPLKQHAARTLLDFLDEPQDSARRTQAGVYATYEFGSAPARVRLILLDVRAERDAYSSTSRAQDMLGREQWHWLERVLQTNEAEVVLIGSGIQVLPHANPRLIESWSRLPASQAKLLALLAKHNVTGVHFLSGDVHVGEVQLARAPGVGVRALPEFTSSGLTHAWDGWIAPGWRQLVPPTTRVPDRLYNGKNFGEVLVQPAADGAHVTFNLFDAASGRLVWSHPVPHAHTHPRAGVGLRFLHAPDAVDEAPADELPVPEAAEGARWLMNGLPWPQPHVAALPLRGALMECADADVGVSGFSPACARFMMEWQPYLTQAHFERRARGERIVVAAAAAVAAVLLTLAALLCAGRAPRVSLPLQRALAVACVSVLVYALREVL